MPTYRKVQWVSYLAVLALSLAFWAAVGRAEFLYFGLITMLVITIQFQIYGKTREIYLRVIRDHRQTQAMLSIFSQIHPVHPLPLMDGYTALPDFAQLVISTIQERKPRVIVEAGSGVSTIIAAYVLQTLGQGRIVSLEHEEYYAEQTRQNISAHHLEAWVDIRYAPITPVTIQQEEAVWYDPAQIQDLDRIDVVVVDGPPRHLHRLARFPALPLLIDKLSDDAVILLDDANSASVQETVDLWTKFHAALDVRKVPTAKGAMVVIKKSRG
jgi:predicted O-methyltransferase YrrM